MLNLCHLKDKMTKKEKKTKSVYIKIRAGTILFIERFYGVNGAKDYSIFAAVNDKIAAAL